MPKPKAHRAPRSLGTCGGLQQLAEARPGRNHSHAMWSKLLTQRVHVGIVYGIYLGLKGVPISLLWSLCRYYNDTWTLWVIKGFCRDGI